MGILYERLQKCLECVRAKTDFVPKVALVLGSGLGAYADTMDVVATIDYRDIDTFPVSTVPGHRGRFVFGYIADVPAVVMQGRVHYYEGYSMEEVTFYVRVLHLLGIRRLLLTNAAGGVNERFRVGEFMLLTDHLHFFTASPLRGAEYPAFGPRFCDMSRVYAPRLRELARNCAKKSGLSVQEGVYFYMAGPQFETPAEIRAIRLLGGDAVGMSTVPEAMAAVQCGMEVLGISCITNLAAGMIPDGVVSDEEVKENAGRVVQAFGTWIRAIVTEIEKL